MSLARKLEQRLERIVDSVSAAIFRGGMHSVEIGERLVRQADLLVETTKAGPAIPNHFTVRVNPRHLDQQADPGSLDRELAQALSAAARERGWRTGGPIEVHVTPDAAVAGGSIACDASRHPGVLPSWGQLLDVTAATAHELRDNRVVIGRSPSADLILQAGEVSRTHAVVFRQAGSAWVIDAGSANGTAVNDVAVGAEPVRIQPGDQVRFGPTTFAFRML